MKHKEIWVALLLSLSPPLSAVSEAPVSQADPAEAPTEDAPEMDLSEVSSILEQLQQRLSPTEENLRNQVKQKTEDSRILEAWTKPLPILGILFGFLGYLVAYFQHREQQRQRRRELLHESLDFLTGGTQKRSVGIALVETNWDTHKEFRRRWLAILVNQAIYLLTKDMGGKMQVTNVRIYIESWICFMNIMRCARFEKKNCWLKRYSIATAVTDCTNSTRPS